VVEHSDLRQVFWLAEGHHQNQVVAVDRITLYQEAFGYLMVLGEMLVEAAAYHSTCNTIGCTTGRSMGPKGVA